jgi:hypothetical protein
MVAMDDGAILTAVIGASAATIGVVVAKDSKISEFRQQWIDALREDVAKLCSVSVALYYNNVRYSLRDRLPNMETSDSSPLVEEANNLNYRIRLRLDPKKPKSKELVDALERLISISSFAREPFDVTEKGVLSVLAITSDVIEEAWKTVKSGEWRFRWTFHIASAVLGLSLLAALGHWMHPHLLVQGWSVHWQ